jgi:hypothetical protein
MALSTVVIASILQGCGPFQPNTSSFDNRQNAPTAQPKSDVRGGVVARAQVWSPTNVRAMNIKTGPQEPGAFPFHATVNCDYVQRNLSGASPKFACVIGSEDEVKVKFGGANAEVYAEVAAARLLWALGFNADRMYPVRVICRGCPKEFAGIARDNDEWVFDPATIERKAPGAEFPENGGWSWEELELIDAESGGAPRAHREALKLLAVFLQHTDTKPEQQRLICRDLSAAAADGLKAEAIRCARPYMMLNDVGLTFGKANMFNVNDKAMNLTEWAATPVWKDPQKCVGNLAKSMTGTLKDPTIGEEGRKFLAGLLMQLSDAQINDLFEVSRVTLRLRAPEKARSGFSTVAEWASAFKQKRKEIVDHRCV